MADESFDDVAPNIPSGGDFKMPSLDELLQAIERMDMTEESKNELRESLLARSQDNLAGVLKDQAGAVEQGGLAPDMLVLLILLAIILFVFVFFGYKLYKSLTDRERRKEEKRRQKQQRKKK